MQQRAFTDEQKLQRREAILAGAAERFANRRYAEVTMVDIARVAGVAKGTLYVYFRTKEELFLAYAEREIRGFFAGLERRLRVCSDAEMGPTSVVRALGESIADSPAMIRLLALLHLVLESNTEYERALAFRRALVPLLEHTGKAVERHLPFLVAGSGARLLMTIHGMALGFQQLADPSPVIRRVEQQPGMELFAVDFEEALLGSVDLLLAGMQVRHTTREPQ